MAPTEQDFSGPPSLLKLAQRACIRDVSHLRDVGDTPYHLVYPVLRKIENPQQLKDIEDASPQIADQDAELWKAFIARDIPNWRDKIIEPTNPRSWWKVYRKLMKDEARTKEASEAELRAALLQYDKKRQESQTQYLDRTVDIPQYDEPKIQQEAYAVRAWKAKSKTPRTTAKPTPAGSGVLKSIRKHSAADARMKKFGQIHKFGPTTPSTAVPSLVRTQIAQAPRRKFKQPPKLPPPKPLPGESRIGPTVQMGWQKKIDAAFEAATKQHEGRLPNLDNMGPGPQRLRNSSSPTLPTPPKPQTPPLPARRRLPPIASINAASKAPPSGFRSSLQAVTGVQTSSTAELSPSPPRTKPPPTTSIFMTGKKRTT